MKALACLLALVGVTFAQDSSPEEPPVPKTKLWAGLGVNSPVIGADDVTDPQFFSVTFTLVNDGEKAIDPQVDSSRLLINGMEMADWKFLVNNGPRSEEFDSLPPGQKLLFAMAMGRYFTEPGIYTIKWKGAEFESREVVFRVLPK
jgi:hypothetical protein